ncbi:MAG: glycosyltransferase family 39 protein [Chloroflexota bacterium]|nr:glycosyltransferase family 39 protein [Chloroflexota bacterium]
MLALLPIACFAASVAWLWLKDGGSCSDRSWRWTFISACVLWGVLVTGITELLSLANWIYPLCLAIAWLLVLTAVAGRSVILLSRQPRAVRLPFVDIDNHEVALLACLVLVVALTGVVAAISAPNTWDSMTYHMSRVAHWIQNRSIADYPTHILRQLHQSPWAEYAVMNLQLLGGTDRLANFVQWFSMIGSLIGVSLIIEELGGDRFVQMLGAAIAATIPMGILQASSTQNDFVVSFWLACFTYFVLRIRRTQGQSTPDLPVICGTGASLGLAILTKATAYLFALPFCLVTIAIVLRRPKLRLVGSLTVVPILALALNVGQYQRNMAVYGSPLGPSQERRTALPTPTRLFRPRYSSLMRYATSRCTWAPPTSSSMLG